MIFLTQLPRRQLLSVGNYQTINEDAEDEVEVAEEVTEGPLLSTSPQPPLRFLERLRRERRAVQEMLATIIERFRDFF